MDYAGCIEADADPPGIDRDAWGNLIDTHPLLVRPNTQQIINPFTQKPYVVHPRDSVANLVDDGQHIGILDWSHSDENLLIVLGDLSKVQQHAIQIASQLGGHFIPVESLDE